MHRMTPGEKILEREPDLKNAAREWIGEGWGVDWPVPATEQIAAALLMEAKTQDDDVRRGDSDPSYPVRLRRVAFEILMAEHPGIVTFK